MNKLSSPTIEKCERLTAHEPSFFEHSTIVPLCPSDSVTKSSKVPSSTDQRQFLPSWRSPEEKQGFFEVFELHDRLPRNPTTSAQNSVESALISISRSKRSRSSDRMTECSSLRTTIGESPTGITKPNARSLRISQVDSVWLASYRSTGKKFAVKFLWSPLRSQSVSHRRIIQSQVDIHRKLKHPYIARLSGFLKNIPIDEDEKLLACALVTDYVPSGSLEDQLTLRRQSRTGKYFDEIEARKIISQLCSALRYMHNIHHVAHCDVKLANILHDTDKQQIKLIDFGLAWNFGKEKNYQLHSIHRSDDEKQFLRKGTLNYLSPEQIQGSVRSTDVAKIDTWAVGVCSFELLTGVSPFAQESELSTRHAVLKGTVNQEALNDMPISKFAQSFIQDCFRRDPRKRPSLDVLMKHPWLNFENNVHEASAYSI
mmetsp:Transcript_33916/g.53073  ORF Transcript_33916/g.53073 Transcript_33916/m.53073 type:complete len:428 (-) Transcript_33916:28-1311(-)